MSIPNFAQGATSKTTEFHNVLSLTEGIKINSNTVAVERKNSDFISQEPLISRTAYQDVENNTIQNKIEIKFQNQVCTITDVFTFNVTEMQHVQMTKQTQEIISSNESGNQKEPSRCQKSTEEQRNELRPQKLKVDGLRYLRSFPKNIVKAFLKYMTRKGMKGCSNLQLVVEEVQKIETLKNVNNITVKKITQNSLLSPYFYKFLNNKAEDWLSNSKAIDKEAHLKAIQKYLSHPRKITNTGEEKQKNAIHP